MVGEVVASAQVGHAAGGEWLAGAGAVALLIELLGGLGVGVIVEQAVERAERVGAGLALLPGRERDRDRERGGRPTAEADVQVDLLGAVQGDVLDQQPRDALALAIGGGGI